MMNDAAELPNGEYSDGDGASSIGEVVSAAGVSEEVELSGVGVGTRGVAKELAGELAEGDAVFGEVDPARVSISTFIPWLQCPSVPQMKYFLPGEESGMVVVPPE